MEDVIDWWCAYLASCCGSRQFRCCLERKSSLLLSAQSQQIAAYNDSIVANIIQEILQPLWHLTEYYCISEMERKNEESYFMTEHSAVNKGQVLINKLYQRRCTRVFSNCDFLGHNILFRTKHNRWVIRAFKKKKKFQTTWKTFKKQRKCSCLKKFRLNFFFSYGLTF